MGGGLRGNINVDFAVAVAMFLFALVSVFAYIGSQYDSRIWLEEELAASLLQGGGAGLPQKVPFEMRIIRVEGYSSGEFVSLSGYDIDLILDEKGEFLCFDGEKEGFVANISGSRTFYLYSTKEAFEKERCIIGEINDRLGEKISSPVYLELFTELPVTETAVGECEQIPVVYLPRHGFKSGFVKSCI
ncbi:MAG: hypothetical protein ACP5E4_02905 [Candidatus Aenigmatarchaeota archaeon]